MQITQLHSLYDTLKDKYLTWKTGDDKQERAWKKWRQETINYRASTVDDYFKNFKHIIEVDYEKVYTFNGWNDSVVESLDEYCYPNRELGDNLVINIFRVIYNNWDGRYHLNDIGGTDKVFAATNNSTDAILIALKYS